MRKHLNLNKLRVFYSFRHREPDKVEKYDMHKKVFLKTFGCSFGSLLALCARRSLRINQKFRSKE
jgi:hypothetical protein